MNHYDTIVSALSYISENREAQPDLTRVAEHVHLSPHHFQRIFVEWCGVSPKRFLQYLNAKVLREKLKEGQPILEAALDTGLSGPGRAHDLFIKIEGVAPGIYKNGYKGITISYGFYQSPFGLCMLAGNQGRICKFDFIENESAADTLLQKEFPNAELIPDQIANQSIIEHLFALNPVKEQKPIDVWVKGTPFQLKVWEALLKIPEGHLRSYDAIASNIAQPKAARAVGSAIGKNPIAYLIPCHRVIRKEGNIGSYRWGSVRKMALLGYEAAIGKQTITINHQTHIDF